MGDVPSGAFESVSWIAKDSAEGRMHREHMWMGIPVEGGDGRAILWGR